MSIADHTINRIDTVYLPAGARWINRNQHQARASQIRRTLDGGIHEYSQAVSVGRPIVLEVTYPYSWLYESKYSAIETLAETEGGQYVFYWRSPNNGATETYQVIFDWSQGPAVDVQHRLSAAMAIDQGIYEGQIKLITVL